MGFDSDEKEIKRNIKSYGDNKKDKSPILPPISSGLERALKEWQYGNSSFLEAYKRGLIQSLISGTRIPTPETLREMRVFGLSDDDYFKLMELKQEYTEKFNPSELDFKTLVHDLTKFFEFLNLNRLLPKDAIIYSFGCGLAPEATAFNDYLNDQLQEFAGFDINSRHLSIASQLNRRPSRNKFQTLNLSHSLPEGSPHLIIIRNPNIYAWEKSGQNTIDPEWIKILDQLRERYPRSAILITTVSKEEAMQVALHINSSPNEIKDNPFSTQCEETFPGYGTFTLPIGADKYYILQSPLLKAQI